MDNTQLTSKQIRFLALGDSYTCGESVLSSERWPDQLASLLRNHGYPVQGPEIVARTGWTTSELSQAIQKSDLHGPFDLVSLLIGVNNQFRGLNLRSYRADFADLLQRSIKFAGDDPRRVLVLSIPDWGVTQYGKQLGRGGISEEIDQFNVVNREEASRLHVQFIDITPCSRQAELDPRLTADDDLHPSGTMYTEWARLALPAALSALNHRTK